MPANEAVNLRCNSRNINGSLPDTALVAGRPPRGPVARVKDRACGRVACCATSADTIKADEAGQTNVQAHRDTPELLALGKFSV